MNIEDKMKAYLDEKGSEVFTSYSDQGNASFDVYRETVEAYVRRETYGTWLDHGTAVLQ